MTEPSINTLTRRGLLGLGAGAGSALLLAACGGGGGPAGPAARRSGPASAAPTAYTGPDVTLSF